MPIGTTNIHLDDDGSNGGIFSDVNQSNFTGSDLKFSDLVINDWAAGPAPGDGTNSYWAYGLKTGSDNPLYNPMNSASGQQTSNYKFSYFKNSYAYFDQANYVIDLYIENNLPPAGRGNPPNDVDVDFSLKDDTLTANSICAMGGIAPENGGTYGPIDVSQSFTFNVEYFYIEGGVNNQGFNPYNFDLIVDGTTVLTLAGGTGSQSVDYTMFSSVPTNTGNGFVVDCIFN